MNTQIKLVFFDIGGVLFDEGGTDYLVKQFHISPHKFRRARWKYLEPSLLGKISTDEMHIKTLSEFGVKTDIKNFNDYWAKNSQIYPVGHELLKKVYKFFPVGLLTNNTLESLFYYQKYNLIPDVDYQLIIESSKIGLKKPFKEIYEYAQKQSGFEPNQLLFIDDRQINLDTAKKLNWHAKLFDRHNQQNSANEILKFLSIS